YTIEKTDFTYSAVDATETLLSTDALNRVLKHFMGDYYVIFEVFDKAVRAIWNAIASIIK
ncbi:MAG TPA: hypothetical protein DCY31_07960, partial [Ruminococcaceae bacterium]|nr:hypothetical protein [Oscillospiraceae bacterium]